MGLAEGGAAREAGGGDGGGERVGGSERGGARVRGGVHVGCDRCEVLDDFLCAFCFACAGFARDEDALVLALVAHVDPCAFGDGKDVGRVLVAAFVAVLLDDRIGVQGETRVRVDRYEEQA